MCSSEWNLNSQWARAAPARGRPAPTPPAVAPSPTRAVLQPRAPAPAAEIRVEAEAAAPPPLRAPGRARAGPLPVIPPSVGRSRRAARAVRVIPNAILIIGHSTAVVSTLYIIRN